MIGDLAVLAFAALVDPAAYGMEQAPAPTDGELEEIVRSPLEGGALGYTSRSDLDRAEAALAEVSTSATERALLLAFTRERARAMLDDPTFLAAVELLTDVLAECGTLSGEQAVRVIEAANETEEAS